MKSRLAYFLLAVLAVGACSEEEQASDSRARVYYIQDSLLSLKSVYVTLDDGNSIWEFEPHNFRRVETDSNRFTSPEVQTQANGTLQMIFHLVTSNGSPFCDGSLVAPLSPNWRWSFEFVHVLKDSVYACSDCIKVSIYEIYDQAHLGESIHVLWRGRGP